MKRINRREAVAIGLATPLTLLAGRGADAAAAGAVYSSGFFKVPELDRVLIGLLLPAVQKAREAAGRVLLVDSAGKVVLDLKVPGQSTPTPVFLEITSSRDPQTTARQLVIKRGDSTLATVPSPDGILIGLLLPAVQRGPGLLAGAVQLFGDGSVRELLPYLEQDNVYLRSSASHYFAGPFSLAAEETAQIGLLLPAVQKVREAARLLLLNSQGSLVAEVKLPTEKAAGAFVSAFVEVSLAGDGSVRVESKLADGSVRPTDAGSPDGILIGLLLPAVQRNGSRAGLVGGSLQLGSETVGFTEVSGLAK